MATVKRLWAMHLFALIPGQGASQLLRQLADVLGKRSNNSRRVLAGILMSIVKRVLRSTRVAMCVSFAPVRRSPSQCPGTAPILNLGGPLAG